MALKGVIQGQGGQGGQLSGSGVTSVALSGPAPFIVGPPVTSAGTLTFDFSGTAIPVADGGTGANNFTSNAVVLTGPSSTAPLTSVVLPQQSSAFLNGMGVFAVPVGGGGPGGGVSSVDLSLSSEFRISGNPVTSAGTLVAGFIQPLAVGHGGTGMGSFGPGVVMGGLNSTAPLQGLPLNNLTSNFLRGDGVFAAPPPPPAGGTGTVTSVDLALSSEFTVSGNPITTSGQLVVGWAGPLNVAHGGTGMGSFGPGIIMGGLSSTGDLQGLPLTNLTSTFLDGTGNFSVPPSGGGAGAGTVTSVALQLSSEFNVTGSPITSSGTLMGSWVFQQPHTIFSGPTSAVSATPSFRPLISDDLPQSISGKTFTSNTFQNPSLTAQQLTFGSSIKWNMNSGAIGLLSMDSTAVGMMDTPSNLPAAGTAILRITQLGTGLPSINYSNYWKFEGGTHPTLSSGFGNIDVLSLYMESSAAYGVARKKFS